MFVRPNRYEPGRANVAILNWDRLPEVALDLAAAGLSPAKASSYAMPSTSTARRSRKGTWTGAPIAVPMAPRQVAILGDQMATPPAAGPEFAAYVVVPSGTTVAPTPDPTPTSVTTAEPTATSPETSSHPGDFRAADDLGELPAQPDTTAGRQPEF